MLASGFFARRWLRTFFMAGSLCLAGKACYAQPAISIDTASNGNKQFVLGNQPYMPIGVNFIFQHHGAPYPTFDMFDQASFNPKVISRNLASIHADGYNFVRLWLKGFDTDKGFGLSSPGLSNAYVDNVLSTLQMARADGLHVVLTGAFHHNDAWLPLNYLPPNMPGDNVVGGMNRLLLVPQMATATAQFYHDLLLQLQQKDSTILSTIFYVDMYNEMQFETNMPPFDKTSGVYNFAGKDYDLGNATSRQALMDHAATAWIHTVSTAIKAVDPNMLVTASSFPLAAFGHKHFDGGRAPRAGVKFAPYPVRPAAALAGGMDIIDIHIYTMPAHDGYPAYRAAAPAVLKSNEITAATSSQVPLIAGEFGTHEKKLPGLEQALAEMRDTRNTMCSMHFSGYAVWVWLDDEKSWKPYETNLMQTMAPKNLPPYCKQS